MSSTNLVELMNHEFFMFATHQLIYGFLHCMSFMELMELLICFTFFSHMALTNFILLWHVNLYQFYEAYGNTHSIDMIVVNI